MRFVRTLIVFAALLLLPPALAQADPAQWAREGWQTDFTKSSISFDEIVAGGPPRDGIPRSTTRSLSKRRRLRTSTIGNR